MDYHGRERDLILSWTPHDGERDDLPGARRRTTYSAARERWKGPLALQWRGMRSVRTPSARDGRLYAGVGPKLLTFDASSGALLRAYIIFEPSADPGYVINTWCARTGPCISARPGLLLPWEWQHTVCARSAVWRRMLWSHRRTCWLRISRPEYWLIDPYIRAY